MSDPVTIHIFASSQQRKLEFLNSRDVDVRILTEWKVQNMPLSSSLEFRRTMATWLCIVVVLVLLFEFDCFWKSTTMAGWLLFLAIRRLKQFCKLTLILYVVFILQFLTRLLSRCHQSQMGFWYRAEQSDWLYPFCNIRQEALLSAWPVYCTVRLTLA